MEHAAASIGFIEEIQRPKAKACPVSARQVGRRTEIGPVDALWQDFAIIKHEPNAASPDVACERMTYSHDPRGPAEPAWGTSTASRPGEIEFGHINLCKKVFDLGGLSV
jgi:hypothetical protein